MVKHALAAATLVASSLIVALTMSVQPAGASATTQEAAPLLSGIRNDPPPGGWRDRHHDNHWNGGRPDWHHDNHWHAGRPDWHHDDHWHGGRPDWHHDNHWHGGRPDWHHDHRGPFNR
ncbi:hypothetical protein [Streptosporangium sp. 'caverna']|uniref:hypothetical protein n=1 Tax=Streptosporangium sp. 'caverna' TaxID=2202249 RepID=UPI0013A6AAAF|nr:hypothetical protein [Streptosporangium sp. 'caverna']